MPPSSVPSHTQEALVAMVIVVFMASSGVIDSRWGPAPRADDPDLVSRVAAELIPPSTAPYNLSEPDKQCWGQSQQMRLVQAITRNKTGGFFVETGAYDGEQMTNTLLLEREFGWRGLLIEPSRTLFPRLVQKRRRAWLLRACCSQTGEAFEAMFRDQTKYGLNTVEDGLSGETISGNVRRQFHPESDFNRYPVTCYPLYTVLLALNTTSVDFFSLDVEGVEMGILAYLPWHLLDIKILLVEFHLSHFWNPQTDQIRWYMERQGYIAVRLLHDWLFVKRDSEYAAGAEETARRVRQELADGPPPPGEHVIPNPFND